MPVVRRSNNFLQIYSLPFNASCYFYGLFGLSSNVQSIYINMKQEITRARIELSMLFLLYLYLLPRVSMDYDMSFWREWALIIKNQGLTKAYDSSINYFPVFLYGLYLYDLLQGSVANITQNIYCIKILFICFDFLPIVLLTCFHQKLLNIKIPYLYLMLNVAYLFNSMIWGQIDSIYSNLAFLAIIIGLWRAPVGIILYILALNTKAQAIEFLPIIIGVLLYSIKSPRVLIASLVSAVATQLVLIAPFIASGGVAKLFSHALHSVDLYNNLSISAFNIWYLIAPSNPYFINDKTTFILLSYKSIGLILFGISAILILLPFYKTVLRQRKSSFLRDAGWFKLIFLATGMLCLCFFYFNSQMHERYSHPIIIFFFFYAVVSGDYKLYILGSIPYLLSLDKCFSFPEGFLPIIHFKIIYASQILALWYTAALGYGGFVYYNLVKFNKGATH